MSKSPDAPDLGESSKIPFFVALWLPGSRRAVAVLDSMVLWARVVRARQKAINPSNVLPKISILWNLALSEAHHWNELRWSDLGESPKIPFLVVIRLSGSRRTPAGLDLGVPRSRLVSTIHEAKIHEMCYLEYLFLGFHRWESWCQSHRMH